MSNDDLGAAFLRQHAEDSPLLLPNPWDRGSALALVTAGFSALATTSAGFANSLGRADGAITLSEAIGHAADIAELVDVPVSCDFENAFADDPVDVGANVTRLLRESDVAGFSVEDYDGHSGMYDIELATERVHAAVESARSSGRTVVVTARAENFIRGVDPTSAEGMADTIDRLRRFSQAGADVLYAPGLVTAVQIGEVVRSVDRPVNVLALPETPTVDELTRLGVARISVGSAFSLAAYGALADAAEELLGAGTHGYWKQAARGGSLRRAFRQQPPTA